MGRVLPDLDVAEEVKTLLEKRGCRIDHPHDAEGKKRVAVERKPRGLCGFHPPVLLAPPGRHQNNRAAIFWPGLSDICRKHLPISQDLFQSGCF